MPKIKTHKATTKRFVKTKTDKLMHRKAGQDHFNARETGNVKRNKRRDLVMNESYTKIIRTMAPYK